MQPIWKVDKLKKLCKRDKPLIRDWALKKLSFLYPEEAAETNMKMMNDNDEYIGIEATQYFFDNYENQYEKPLLDFYKEFKGFKASRLAKVFLKNNSSKFLDAFNEKYMDKNYLNDLDGYVDSVFNIAETYGKRSYEIVKTALDKLYELENFKDYSQTLFGAGLRAGIDLVHMLELSINNTELHSILITDLLVEVSEICGLWFSKVEIEEYDDKSIILEQAEYIDSQNNRKTGKKIFNLYKKKDFSRIMDEIFKLTEVLITQKKKEKGEELFELWESGYGKPRRNIEFIRIIKNNFNKIPDQEKYKFINFIISNYALLLELSPLIGVVIKKLNESEAFGVYIQNRDSVEEDDELIKIFKKSDHKETLTSGFLNYLNKFPDSLANIRIISLLGEIADEKSLKELLYIECINEECFDEKLSVFIKRSSFIFSNIGDFINKENNTVTEIALNSMTKLPFESVIKIIIENWDWLWWNHKDRLLELVREIGDSRFISVLKKHLSEDNFMEGEVFCLLCQINGKKDPLVKVIEKELKKRKKNAEKAMQALTNGDGEELINEPVELELLCRNCVSSYRYEIHDIFIGNDSDDIIIFDTVICRKCSAIDHYQITDNAKLTLAASVFTTMEVNKNRNDDDFIQGTIRSGKINPVDGKKMNFSEAEEYYKKKVEKEPENSDVLFSYANVLRMSKKAEDAIPLYKKIIEMDPLSADVYSVLGFFADHRGQTKIAYEYLKKAVALIDEGKFRKIHMDLDQYKMDLMLKFFELSDELNKSIPKELIDKYHNELKKIRGISQ